MTRFEDHLWVDSVLLILPEMCVDQRRQSERIAQTQEVAISKDGLGGSRKAGMERRGLGGTLRGQTGHC